MKIHEYYIEFMKCSQVRISHRASPEDFAHKDTRLRLVSNGGESGIHPSGVNFDSLSQSLKNHLCLRQSCFSMAERVGFEPTRGLRP